MAMGMPLGECPLERVLGQASPDDSDDAAPLGQHHQDNSDVLLPFHVSRLF